jgi:hypothetical protein
VAAIKTHPFFDSIDWQALQFKLIDPPSIPTVGAEGTHPKNQDVGGTKSSKDLSQKFEMKDRWAH